MSEPDLHNGAHAGVADSAAAPPIMTLRQARERAGLHMVALAASLKVPVHRLEALEAGRFEELPDLTFARALAMSVCRVLKVDAGPILASFPATPAVRLGEPQHALNAPMPSRHAPAIAPTAGLPGKSVPWPLAFALLVLVVAVVLWFVLPPADTSSGVTPPPSEPVAAGAPVTGPLVSALPPASPPVEAVEPSSPPPAVQVSESAAAPSPTVTPAEPSPAPPAALPADGLLQLRVQETAWVQVTGASGRVLMQRELRSGEVVGFSTDLPLAVVLGRADVVQVKVRGQALDLAPHIRSNVARFDVR
jgi:cytoskeleton protein RodZ